MDRKENTYYFPWIRKGLLNKILEKDFLGNEENISGAISEGRASLEIRQEFGITSTGKEGDKVMQSESTMVELVGPGDITSVSERAILKVMPSPEKEAYPADYYPYVEFWEPDFLWRYTPAAVNNDKLRPWLALVVCKEDAYKIGGGKYGNYVSFSFVDEENYEQTFLPVAEFWKCAHAQGFSKDKPEICRLLALRKRDRLEENTRYTAFLIPSFEIGRLKGLGIDEKKLQHIVAQKPAWEDSLTEQKKRVRAFDFPIYYSWSFKTGRESFDALARKLVAYVPEKTSIKVDVTSMGEGLDYRILSVIPERKSIDMPGAAGVPLVHKDKGYPSDEGDEKVLRDRMKNLLSQNSVFIENKALKQGNEGVEYGNDDPLVVPPVYGAKHAMATSLDEEDCTKEEIPWLAQLNLNVQNRAVAGLGKRTVQLNQEEFMNRAWKQVEAVNALNMQLYRRLMSYNSQKLLGKKTIDSSSSAHKYIATLMQYLSSMKNVTVGKEDSEKTSLADILEQSHIPQSFATATFRNVTDAMSRIANDLDTDTLMENIVQKQLFRQEECDMACAVTLQQLSNAAGHLYELVLDAVLTALGPFLRLENGKIVKKETCKEFLSDKTNNYMGVNLMHSSHVGAYMMQMFGYLPGASFKYKQDETTDAWKFITYGDPLGKDKIKELYHKWLYFYEHDILNSSFCGYAHKENGDAVDLVVIPEKIYNALFGDRTPVTNLFDMLYVVCKEKLMSMKDLQELHKEEGLDEHGKKVVKHAVIPATFSKREPYADMSLYHGTAYVTTTGIMAGTPYIDRTNELVYPDQISEAQRSKFADAYRYVADFIADTYDCLDLYLEYLEPQYIRKFEDWKDLLSHLKQDCNEKGRFSLLPVIGLDTYVKHQNELQTDDKKELKQPVSEEKVQEIKRGFNDEEAYRRMCDVAESYYKKFFGNSLGGEQLRKSYIDELLRSKYPVLAYPVFPEPVYHYLKQYSDKFILPSAQEQLPDTVSMLVSNPEFIESFLCGMNTEMAKEMLWREYPTDERGSYFRKFWDCETSESDIMQDNFFDIKPIHLWKGELGENQTLSKTGLVIFSVKGDLMKSYPDTKVNLHKAVVVQEQHTGKKKLLLDEQASEMNGGIIRPTLEAYLGDNIYIVGFKTDIRKLLGNPQNNDGGYFLAFSEDVEDLNFSSTLKVKNGGEDNAAKVAKSLIDKPTTYGKHISLFLNF